MIKRSKPVQATLTARVNEEDRRKVKAACATHGINYQHVILNLCRLAGDSKLSPDEAIAKKVMFSRGKE